MFIKSIRWRLQLWYGAFLALLVLAMLVTYYFREKETKTRMIDYFLRERVPTVMRNQAFLPITGEDGARPFSHKTRSRMQPPPHDRMEPPGRPRRDQRPPRGPRGTRDPRGPRGDSGSNGGQSGEQFVKELLEVHSVYVCTGIANRGLEYYSPNAPEGIDLPELPIGKPGDVFRWSNGDRQLFHVDDNGGVLLLGISDKALLKELNELRWKLGAVGSGVMLLSLMVGWWITGRALSPVRMISQTAQTIAEGDLKQRIDVQDRHSELGQLVTVLNTTFGKLDYAFDQQARFTADASHELRTPLNVITLESDWALSDEQMTREEMLESFETCLKSARHMRGIIESLLELARIDSGEAQWEKETTFITDSLSESVELLQTLAKDKGVKLKLQEKDAWALVDPQMIKQVFINVISNAIHHSPEQGVVDIVMEKSSDSIRVKVTDSGSGVPEDVLPHIFDRFYRADKVRSRTSGRTGLGLPISKAILDAHQGDIEVVNVAGAGARITITIPQDF